MHHLPGRRSTVEDALVAFFKNHHATALDARIVGDYRRGHKICEGDIGDKSSSLVHLQQRLLALPPLRNAQLAAENAGVDAHVWKRLGQREGPSPRLAVLARLRRRCQPLVVTNLLGGAAFMDRRQGQKTSQARSRRAAIHPCQFKGRKRQCQVLGSGDESALFRFHKGGGDPGAIERLHHRALGRGPFVRVALSRSHHPRHRASRHPARRLHQHLQVEPVRKPPLNLAHRIPGKGVHGFHIECRKRTHSPNPRAAPPILAEMAWNGL